ncbi:hypothetical protein NDU88_000533 [Pleurodeles waltl]|uniref:Uncharacterized protein n=1 Tax=Pleurodeles waltl TaxID=8319 RepID=A0AAV7MJZ6_PLEWA|nr:hypothetical protein NDU88_000533 [Pleurodeles waltl]
MRFRTAHAHRGQPTLWPQQGHATTTPEPRAPPFAAHGGFEETRYVKESFAEPDSGYFRESVRCFQRVARSRPRTPARGTAAGCHRRSHISAPWTTTPGCKYRNFLLRLKMAHDVKDLNSEKSGGEAGRAEMIRFAF